MRKSVLIALIHIGFWLCYALLMFLIVLILYSNEQVEATTGIGEVLQIMGLLAIGPSVICFYSFYSFLFPRFLRRKRYFLAFVLGVLMALGSVLITYAILWGLGSVAATGDSPWYEFVAALIFASVVGFTTGVIALIIRGFITWFEEVRQKEALLQKNQEIELALIKAQLDPHFLFNTINNIDVLMLRSADLASEYLNKLSDIMRFMLYET